MVELVNPFLRSEEDLTSEANICDCICNVAQDNNSSGIWASRLTFNVVCGCACQDDNHTNEVANKNRDKDQ
ncbi:MAG: hypothetical protein HUJ71_01225 [Pseudobutyrivibrio sp.]|nr:hypothetical protein [Pseudobutyrivibrio sp.]